MPQSLASDSVYSGGKLPPTLTPTGHFAGKPTLPISRSVTLIGARKQARLQLISSTVSQNHALIVNADSGAYIRDLASRMGVQVNGRQAAELPLADGDEIQIGRFTFRFNASPNAQPVEPEQQQPAAPGRVQVDGVDYTIPIEGKTLLIGRRDSCDIHLLEDSVSTTHAIIFEMDGRRYIRDLASRTGTFVNGKQVHQVELMPGDEVRIGDSVMHYAADAGPGVTQEEIVPTDLAAAPADLEIEPTDLAPAEDEIEVEPEEEVAPPPIPTRRPSRPQTAAEANAAAAEALELVHDQPDDFEPVELAPVELEALENPDQPLEAEVELEPEPVEVEEVAEVEEVELEPEAPAEGRQSEHDALELEPIDAGEIGGTGFHGLEQRREITAPAEEEQALEELTPRGESPLPVDDEIEIEPAESFEMEPVEPPVAEEEPAPSAPPRVQAQEEPSELAADDLELAPLDEEPVEAEVEEVAPIADVQPPAVEEPAEAEVELEPLFQAEAPPVAEEEPQEQLDLAPLAHEREPAPAPHAPSVPLEPEPVAEAPAPVASLQPEAPEPPSPPTLVKPSAPRLVKPAPKRQIEPEPERIKPAPARPAAEAPAPSAPLEPLPLDAFTAPPEDQTPFKFGDVAVEDVPELRFDESTIEGVEDLAAPLEAAPIAEAAIGTAAVGGTLDFGEVEELPDSIFTAALDDTAYQVPPLDLAEETEAPTAADEAADEGIQLGLEEPPLETAEPPPVEEEPVEEAIAEAAAEEDEPVEEPVAEAPVEEEPGEKPVAEAAVEEESLAEAPVAEAPVEEEQVEAEPVAQAPVEEEPLAEAPAEELETIAPAEATPESAQALDEAITEPPAPPVGEVEEVELTDSTFGREVSEFAADTTGPIVDEAPALHEPPVLEGPPAELAPPPMARPSRLGPGASQLQLEPLEEPPATPPPPQVDEFEPLLEEEPLLPVDEEPAPRTAEERERFFDLEPIEAPVPAARDEQIELTPTEPPTTAEVQEAIETVEAVEAVEAAEPTPSAAAPVEEEVEVEPLEVEPLEVEPVEVEPVEVEPVEVEPVEVEPVEVEPVEVEPVEVEPVEVEPVEVVPEPVAEARPPEEELQEFEVEPQPVEELPTIEEEPAEPSAPAVASTGLDTLSDLDIELALEAAEIAPEPAPVIPSPRPAPAPEPMPIAESPRLTPPPPAPSEPPQAPRTQLEEFNWGANQEHFFGGMPLRLTPQAAPPQGPAPTSTPFAPAAREDELPEPFEPPAQQPPPPQRTSPAQPQAPGAQPTLRPAPRKPPLAPQPRPMQTSPGAKAPKGPPITTGFDGLAAASGREADVFSSQGNLTAGFAPGIMDDVFGGGRRIGGGGSIPPTETPPAEEGVAGAPRARRATKADPMGDAWAPVTPPDVEPPTPARPAHPVQPSDAHVPPQIQPSAPPPPRKKRRWFGLKSLIVLMIMCAAAAAAGVFAFMPVDSAVVATLKYENFNKLPESAAIATATEQVNLLGSDAVRIAAADKVRARRMDPGFLQDFVQYSRAMAPTKFDTKAGVLSVTYPGRKTGGVIWPAASEADRARFTAVLSALHEQNKKRIDDAQKLRDSITSLEREIARTKIDIDQKKKEIDDLAAASERPDASQRVTLENEVAQLARAQSETADLVARLTDELQALRADAPADAVAIPPAADPQDAAIAAFQADLKQVEQRIAEVRAAEAAKAKAARSQLDAALDAFNKSIAAAQAAGNNNPELLTYLNAAEKLLAQSRELTDGLIARQQKQYAELTDLKVRLNDKLLARRAEVWKKDPELLKLMDDRDIQTRRYNAAIGQNLTEDAANIKAHLDYVESAIRARQTIVADDGFYADAIDQLEKIITATQKGLEQDRATTLAALEEMQSTFSKGAPATLTPEQKRLAEEIDQRLAAVSAARKQYAADTDAARQQADQQIRKLQIEASQIASKISGKKEQLAAANGNAVAAAAPAGPWPEDRNRAIEAKSTELAAAQKSAAEIKAAHAAASAKLADLNKRIEAASAAGNRRDLVIGLRDSLDKELTGFEDKLALNKRQLELAVYPLAPTDENVQFTGNPDERPKFALMATGGIVGVFVFAMALMSFASRRGGAEEQASEYAPEAYETDATNGEVELESAEERDREATVQA